VIPRPDGSVVHLLEIEQVHGDDIVHLPDFLTVDREVTSDKRYKSANLAVL
jgi:CYTH domain-containing protein